eukprot:scaffold88706_cov21-Tisochrysis_lutea.AAC.2
MCALHTIGHAWQLALVTGINPTHLQALRVALLLIGGVHKQVGVHLPDDLPVWGDAACGRRLGFLLNRVREKGSEAFADSRYLGETGKHSCSTQWKLFHSSTWPVLQTII